MGLVLSYAGNKAYDNNFLGTKTGVDAVGHAIDKGFSWINNSAKRFVIF